MKRLLFFMFFFLTCSVYGQGKDEKELPNGGSARYNLLMEERKSIIKEIENIATNLPTQKDEKREQELKRLSILKGNIEEIDKEIAKAQKEPPTKTDFPKTDEKAVQKKEEPDQKNHETWDVFKSF